jgi:hypothetical protein
MWLRVVAVTLLSSAAAACSCNGINSFPDRPVGMDSRRGAPAVWVNGSLIPTFRADPVEVNGLKAWINFETNAIYSGQRLARISVQNSQGVTRDIPGTVISYHNERGFKSTGPVELAPYMTRGVNTITFYITNGVTGGIRLRGALTAQGSPAGSSGTQCFESDGAPAVSTYSFKVYYNRDRARTS